MPDINIITARPIRYTTNGVNEIFSTIFNNKYIAASPLRNDAVKPTSNWLSETPSWTNKFAKLFKLAPAIIGADSKKEK